MPGQGDDQGRFAIGANYYVTPAASIRSAFLFNYEESGFGSENNGFILQLNVIL